MLRNFIRFSSLLGLVVEYVIYYTRIRIRLEYIYSLLSLKLKVLELLYLLFYRSISSLYYFFNFF